MTIEEMKRRKRELGYSVEALSKLTGVPVGTLQKIFSGYTKNPRRETIEKLTAVLESKPYTVKNTMLHVAEPEAAYEAYTAIEREKEAIEALKERERIKQEEERILHSKKQGEFTLEDYYALPDGVRYELIDGVLFKMEAPTADHQDAAGLLYLKLMMCVMQHHMPCHPYISPIDVQLDCDDRTMVEPDVIVVCDQEKNREKHIVGAPEFAAEVLSPSTRKKDIFIKLRKYQEAGVKECWLIDPERQQVTVWLFYKDAASKGYSFDDHIPVSISDGKCEVCFHELMKQMNFNKG